MQFGYTGGDLTSVIDPLDNQSTSAYDAVGRVVSSVDPQGNVTTTQYNNLNLVTQITDSAGNNTSFTYDPNGNLLSLTDALNHATNWTYDNMDRTITRKDSLQRQASYTYDLNGNIASSTDRKGLVTSFTYDSLNRVKLVGYNTVVNGGNTTYESTIGYTYDAGNRLTQAVDSAGGTITEAYDNLDRLTTETTPQGSISYGYDNADRRASMTVAGQPQVSYSYDNANRLTQITQGSSNVGFSYDNVNRRTSLTLANGVSMSYGFDNDSRVTGITYNFGTNTLGNLTYSYDQLGRRTQVGGSFARTNLPAAVTSAVYDAANELTNWNGTTISYDANGNMLSDGHNAFTWNPRNQVATLSSVSLQYDAFGRRIKNAAGTSFLFDGANATQELSGSTVTANIWTGGIDKLFQRTDSNGTVVPLTDALGSVIGLTNSSGTIVTTYSYDPFGITTTAGAASANPSQYTGRENEGNGLYFYRGRYYNPVMGRFISQDPIGVEGSGTNLYAYTADDPIDYTDPYGLVPIPDYVTLGGSGSFIVGAGVNVSINLHNGNVYIVPHVTGGAQAGPGGSVMLGVLQPNGAPWDSSIDNSRNTAAQVDAFLGGPAGFGCIGNGVGGCVSSNAAGTGYEGGLMTPGGYAGLSGGIPLSGRGCPPKPQPQPEPPEKPWVSDVPPCDDPIYCVKNFGKPHWKDGVPAD